MAKQTRTKKAARKTAVSKKVKPKAAGKIDRVVVRMYCLGTGDCFILKFMSKSAIVFTVMIDCGSCQGGPKEFKPYIDDLAAYVNNKIDLLIITHEHNDHVNGFAKCASTFEGFDIKKAWFAWTEHPDDPGSAAEELQKKRSELKLAFRNALTAIENNTLKLEKSLQNDYYKNSLIEGNRAFISGMQTLAEINLPADGDAGKSLAGMIKIKEILENKEVPIQYLEPGKTVTVAKAKGVKFHVLGPPKERKFIFSDGKEGTDVYKKKMALYESSLAANAFINMDNKVFNDLPFSEEYLVNGKMKNDAVKEEEIKECMGVYNHPDNEWRRIDSDWLNSAGSLALRLDSHINNTSLALAIEMEDSGKVLLFPGDAEFGSWDSWHAIKKWEKKGKNGKHFVEDLLNRTIFYKVAHHLSFNGTALQKGIEMMDSPELVAMATLDRKRISKVWKNTMPNRFLMQDLITRCGGKLIIMDEFEIRNAPSSQFNFESLGKEIYEEGKDKTNKKQVLYKQYMVEL